MCTRITVVGGGVTGISTALVLLNEIPNCCVTVISESFTPNTTGDVAAGMWCPYLVGQTPQEKINKWAAGSWAQFLEWYKSGEEWGVSLIRGTVICDTYMPPEPWRHIPVDYVTLTTAQCKEYGKKYVSGYSYTTFFAEPSVFLPKLTEEIKKRGGKFKQQRLASLDDACKHSDVVVNCSGIGARLLVPDPSLHPVRGQVVRVSAPWVNTFLIDESEATLAYILPNQQCVVLGGTAQRDDWNTTVDETTTETILARCSALQPSLQRAVVLRSNAGLRPVRDAGVRLERETRNVGGRCIPVVHNYGHAGSGVTLMWGCAREVSQHVRDITGHSTSAL